MRGGRWGFRKGPGCGDWSDFGEMVWARGVVGERLVASALIVADGGFADVFRPVDQCVLTWLDCGSDRAAPWYDTLMPVGAS